MISPGIDEWARIIISRGFRAASLEAHPDHGGSNDGMRELIAARDLLTQRLNEPQQPQLETDDETDDEEPYQTTGTVRGSYQPCIAFPDTLCMRTTERAALCVFALDGSETWIPFSQIATDSEVRSAGDRGLLIISRWLACEKGLW